MSRSRSKGSDLVWEKRKSHPLSTACRSLESEQKSASEKWRWRGMGDMSEQRAGRYVSSPSYVSVCVPSSFTETIACHMMLVISHACRSGTYAK